MSATATAFSEGLRLMREAQAVKRAPLHVYSDHKAPVKQLDFVTKLRVGIRLAIARCQREKLRGNEERAARFAFQAGCYWGEYRLHWRHLLSLPGYRHVPTYGPVKIPRRR